MKTIQITLLRIFSKIIKSDGCIMEKTANEFITDKWNGGG